MRPAVLLALLTVSSSSIATEPGRDIEYSKILETVAPAATADPDGVFRIQLCAIPGKKGSALPTDLALELRDGDRVQPLPLDAKQCFPPPRQPEWQKPEVKLHVNQPKGTVGLALRLDARVPTSTLLTYATLTESIPVMKRLIASQGVMVRMLAPKMKSVVLKYPPARTQTAIVHAPGGDQHYTSDTKGDLRIPYDADLAAAKVDLSALPQEISPNSD